MKNDRPCVYFVLAEGTSPPLVKIGFARDLKKRVESLSTGCPHPLKVVGYVPGPIALEKELHARFSKFRVRGEWFLYAWEISTYLNGLEFPDPVAIPAMYDGGGEVTLELEANDLKRLDQALITALIVTGVEQRHGSRTADLGPISRIRLALVKAGQRARQESDARYLRRKQAA